jgi:hypothetical protein
MWQLLEGVSLSWKEGHREGMKHRKSRLQWNSSPFFRYPDDLQFDE